MNKVKIIQRNYHILYKNILKNMLRTDIGKKIFNICNDIPIIIIFKTELHENIMGLCKYDGNEFKIFIKIYKSINTMSRILVHELVHAITKYKIKNREKNWIEEFIARYVDNLFLEQINDNNYLSIYGIVYEFLLNEHYKHEFFINENIYNYFNKYINLPNIKIITDNVNRINNKYRKACIYG